MGKANAASTVQVLCTRYGIDHRFQRIAGNMTSKIGIGDVCVGETVFYHDAQLDMLAQSAPFLKEYRGDPALVQAALDACQACGVKAIAGRIATGDTFVGDAATKKAIEEKCHPDCVEMEGAAVSQVAGRNGVPCVVLRAMSDNADESGYEVLVVKQFSIAGLCEDRHRDRHHHDRASVKDSKSGTPGGVPLFSWFRVPARWRCPPHPPPGSPGR